MKYRTGTLDVITHFFYLLILVGILTILQILGKMVDFYLDLTLLIPFSIDALNDVLCRVIG